ncbi:MAG: Txe/YoeB family addiction module toxin [Thermoguttaceae bacterium]|nr:Txe/YoeB family addiction module toxin [Thermoguttaceae bacterium]
MNIEFTETAYSQLMDWVLTDKKMVKKINELIRDIQRSGISDGLGKPEALKYLNAWSRRITQEHRLVYRVEEDRLLILACRGHYE